jgi:hypothetical protein
MFCTQGIDWESTRLWVQTVVGSIAALGTIYTVFVTTQRYRNDKKHEQAQQVYAYIYRDGRDLQLRVGNGSGLPVYDAFVYYLVNPSLPDSNTWEKVEKGIAKVVAEGVTESVLPPGRDVPIVQVLPPGDFRVEAELVGIQGGGRVDVSRFYGVDLVFTDAQNNRWTRRARGQLQESKADPMDLPRFKMAKDLVGMGPPLPYVNIVPID